MGFGDVVFLQVRSVVEDEQFGGPFATFLQKNADDVDRQCADVQCSVDRPAQCIQRMIFKKSQDLNELATALARTNTVA